jgi:hypothetical protein
MATGTGHFGKLLWPGLNKIFGKAYDEFKVEYTDLFDTFKSSKHYEEDLGLSSYGLAQSKAEGAGVTYDSERQAFLTRYTHAEFALGFIITKVLYEDDLYGQAGERRSKGLAFSLRQTKEVLGSNVYNRAFNSSYVGGDGVEMLSLVHPNFAGGTQANELATPADLSEASLEQSVIDLSKLTNDRGLRISVMPKSLIAPVDLMFEAERILMSPYRVGTANNDINALKTMSKFPSGIVVNHYLTDTDAWFVRTNVQDGPKYFNRRSDTFTDDNDFDTDNAKYKATFRCSFGWTDWRGIFGSPGA